MVDPAPNLEYPIEDSLAEEGMQVTHVRRKLTWSKDVLPQHEEGRYKIEIYFRNRSNAPIENIRLHDLIPNNFELASDADQVASKVKEKVDDGEIREWVIKKLDEGEEIRI